MNEAIAKEWGKELRSGRYKQGRGKLRDMNDNCCCLGVLCDIAPNVRWEQTAINQGRYRAISEDRSSSSTSLTTEVKVWAGVNLSAAGKFSIQDLIYANDNGHDFNHIANLIENNWEKL